MLRDVIKAVASKYILNLSDEYINRDIKILPVPYDEIHTASSNPDIIRKSVNILVGMIENLFNGSMIFVRNGKTG